jgi:hypothetical protein
MDSSSTTPSSASLSISEPKRSFAPWWVAVPCDFACIVLFVLGGQESHNINEGFRWIFEVVWPLTVGFFAAALVTFTYTRHDVRWLRLIAAIALGVVLWGALRWAFEDRFFLSISNLVGAAFLLITMGGWRVVAATLRRARAMRSANI